jgi:hypothetical protein
LLSTLLQVQRSVERTARLYQKARAHGWTEAADILLSRLDCDIAAVNAASRPHPPLPLAAVPALCDIVAELTHLSEEFDEMEICPAEKRIHVTTEPVTLQDIRLGPFSIRLHWERLAKKRDASAFDVVAKEPNAAAGDFSCTHPHVRGAALCAGDAAFPIANALNEGRLGDAFQLINSVLHTYNPGSAYVDLDSWDGVGCADCGQTTSSDDLYCCEHCGHDYCNDCTRLCDRCDRTLCLGCATDVHDQRLCPSCRKLADEENEELYENEIENEEDPAAVSDDPVHQTAEVEPPPQTEITHAPSPPVPGSPSRPPCTPAAGLAGGTPGGEGNRIAPDVPAPRAA